MAKLNPDTIVTLGAGSSAANLCYQPVPDRGCLAIATHAGALRVPDNQLCQVAQIENGNLLWVGAIDESMLLSPGGSIAGARGALANALLTGDRLWEIVMVDLLTSPIPGPTTVYQHPRPWVVIGEIQSALLVAPLNHRDSDKISWYQVVVDASELDMVAPTPRASKLEMNHVWSVPSSISGIGKVKGSAPDRIKTAVMKYFSVSARTTARR